MRRILWLLGYPMRRTTVRVGDRVVWRGAAKDAPSPAEVAELAQKGKR